MPMETKRGHSIPPKLVFQFGLMILVLETELLEEQQMFLTAEPSLQPQRRTALTITLLFMFGSGKHTHTMVRMWQSEDNFWN